MARIVKIFTTGADQEQLAASGTILERYPAFVLVSVSPRQLESLVKRYPLEDITDQYRIRLGTQLIDTSKPRLEAGGKLRVHPAYKGAKRLPPGPHHHVVQFIGPVKEGWLRKIRRLGGELREPIQGFAFVVRADEETMKEIAALPFVRWAGHLPHQERIANSVLAGLDRGPDDVGAALPRTRVFPGTYTVEFFDASNVGPAARQIRKLGFEVLSEDDRAKLLTIRDPVGGRGAMKRMRELSAVHGVRIVRERVFKRTSNDVATRIMGSRATLADSRLGLSGEGEVIAVCDTGLDTADPDSIHADFSGRIEWIKSYPITPDFASFINNPGGNDGAADFDSGHGTHVTGSVLGDGSASAGLPGLDGPIRGLAHRANLVFQAVEQEIQWKDPANFQRYGRYMLAGIPADLNVLFGDAYRRQARIHSNSWGGGDPGAYDVQSEQLDRFVWQHKDFCVLVAAGNDGTDEDGDGRINPMSVSSPATAKNCISVGACENERPRFDSQTYGSWWPQDYPVAPWRNDPMADSAEQVVAFSSRGPTEDGRIKPDVVAPGTFILSTRSTMIASNNNAWAGFPASRMYFHMGGTSMATPLTSGAVGLVREYLRKHRQFDMPTAALLKATLIAGAQRLPSSAPDSRVFDNDQGYGRVNLDHILAPTAPARAEFHEEAPGLRTGEVFTTGVNVASASVPLRIVLAYSDYPGATLVNNLNLIAIAPDGRRYVGNQGVSGELSMDTTNNVEVVQVDDPASGSWSIEVVASNVPRGPQDFALVTLAHRGRVATANRIRLQAAPGLDIPDNSTRGVRSTLKVQQARAVSSVRVGVDIRHTYIGDLQVALQAPDRTRVLLHNRSGASADDLVKTYDVSTTPELAALGGKPAQGDWQLLVSDHAGLDIGRLRRWNLEILLEPGDSASKQIAPLEQIPDNDPAGISSTILFPEGGKLREIKVWLDITHTWIGDLNVSLTAPSGESVTLHGRSGGSRDNLIVTLTSAELPDLESLRGATVKGEWILKVQDRAGRDTGKLNRWGLELRW